MNAARMQSIIHGLTGIARKVYDTVPIQEGWTLAQVSAELGRNGLVYEHAKVHGCLRSLKEQGLIRECDGQFQRIEQRPRLVATRTPTTTPQEHNMPAPTSSDPMANLAEIAATLREQARQLLAKADALDAAAIDVAETIERSGEDSAKLRQLQALLKDISK